MFDQLAEKELRVVLFAAPGVRSTGDERGIEVLPTWVRRYDGEYEKLDRLRAQCEAGILKLRVADVVPPERAAEAHRRLEAGGTRGRMVIVFE